MIILRTRSASDSKEMLTKLKKMYKFTKELLDCVEERYEEEDDDIDYRYDDEYEDMQERRMHNARSSSPRYRRSRM